MEENNTLLIIEDNPADSTHLLRLLEDTTHKFTRICVVESIAEAKAFFSKSPPSCCLVDCNLKDGHATDLLAEMVNEEKETLCPFIVITGSENSKNAVELMKQGVMDYLIKPIVSGRELMKVIDSAEKAWNLQCEINYLALHDSLTGLINRNLFVDRLAQLFKEHKRKNKPFSLVYIDLDKFKLINDQFGHAAGDFLLEHFARKLVENLRDTDSAARIGGDEFSVLLPDTDKQQCFNVVQKLMDNLSGDICWNDQYLPIKLSMGITFAPGKALNAHQLMYEADYALYQSKKNGRGHFSIFDQEMENEVLALRAVRLGLPSAIANHELEVAYQPIYGSETNEVIEVEALIRWFYNGSWVSPELIIELVMEQHLSEEFHQFLFNAALAQLKAWKHDAPHLIMALNFPANISPDNLIFKLLEDALIANKLSYKDIVIEITESQFMQHPKDTIQQLQLLESYQAKISIDDFGTGYSSMQYLVDLPCTQLKIDKSFFLNFQVGNKNEKIVCAIISLAKSLNLDIVAEGIESEALVEKATQLGCNKLQGYWLGGPVSAHDKLPLFLKNSKVEGAQLLSLHL